MCPTLMSNLCGFVEADQSCSIVLWLICFHLLSYVLLRSLSCSMQVNPQISTDEVGCVCWWRWTFQIRIVHDSTQLATSERDTTQRLKHLLKSQELLLKAQDTHFLTRAMMWWEFDCCSTICVSLFRDPQADTLPETVATCLGLKNSSTSLCELCVEVISTILERMLGHGERVADARRITRRINTDMQARKCMCEKIWEGNKAFNIRIFVRICLKIPRSSFQCFNALRLRLFLEPSSWSSSSHSTLCCLLSWARVAFQARVLIFVAVSNYFYLHAKRSKCSKHLPCSFEA